MFSPMVWMAAGLLLVLSEFIVPGFLIIFFGLGAMITGLALLAFGMSVPVQLLLFAVSSVLLLALVRWLMPRVFRGREEHVGELPSDSMECAGQIVEVLEPIEPGVGGKVSFMGTEWEAVSEARHGKGEHVRVLRRDNITLVVE